MNAREPLDRRHFVAAALAGVGLVALRAIPMPPVPTPSVRSASSASSSSSSAMRLAGLFARGQSAPRIGRVYLRQAPGERDATTLVRLIADSLAVDAAALHRMDGGALRQRIERRIRQDFAKSRTTSVDGWVLSVTEARLYATTALVRAS
jgi:hypothetical protein